MQNYRLHINSLIEVANRFNSKVASLKDWRLNKAGKHAREIAAKALTSDILIGTAKEIAARFPELFRPTDNMIRVADCDENDRFVWAFSTSKYTGRTDLQIFPLGPIENDMERYVLQKSASVPNGWVLTDTELGIVCRFIEGKFNESQKFTVLEDVERPDVMTFAANVRKMTDWLASNHRDIV